MGVVSQYFGFRRGTFYTVHGKRGKRQFSVILYKFFHISGRGGEDTRTRAENEVREAGKWPGKQMAEDRKRLFSKVFMKLTLESLPLFLACQNRFFLFSKTVL